MHCKVIPIIEPGQTYRCALDVDTNLIFWAIPVPSTPEYAEL